VVLVVHQKCGVGTRVCGHVCCFFAVGDKSAAVAGAADGVRGMMDSSAPIWRRWGCWSGWVRGHLEDTRSRLSRAGRGGVGTTGAARRRRWERRRGGKTESAKARCRSRSWHQPPTGAGCSARTSPRPGAGRVGGERLEAEKSRRCDGVVAA
jgi:hypothetical protein